MTRRSIVSRDPEICLSTYLPHDVSRSVLGHRRATMVFDITGHGRWTVRIDEGAVTHSRGAVSHPTCTVRTDASTLCDLLTGRISVVDGFLSGDLDVRGSMTTILTVGGTLAPNAELSTRAHGRETSAYGVPTGYLEAGDPEKPPVILLHGLGANNSSMLPVLAALAPDHRVICPDLPGFGSSAAPAWRYTPHQLYRWLNAFLDAVDARGAAVIGHSLGGRVALELALRDPDAITGLVLLCPAMAFRRRRLTTLARLLPADLARLPLAVPSWLLHTAARSGLRALFADPDKVPRHWYEAAADEWELSLRHATRRRALWSALLGLYLDEPFGETGLWDRIAALEPPALFLWGDADPLVPARFARHLSAVLPGAKSVILPNCGHVPQFELPEKTLHLICEHLTATGDQREVRLRQRTRTRARARTRTRTSATSRHRCRSAGSNTGRTA
ncbi:alpha/beta fold hydrolase (plasmid) [Rhodococcus pseudokoreensis]|uniref:Alpha/beta fold hydrolase n=2 Tax=Rhodococcus TaxID=1827 RepID=A0ABT4NL76_RHOOP|nr:MULTISPECIES: alpha/beta fold hydrolase [Rhodococcus]MCZ4588138.1 alpha/beta fold hydrolase [Rhodococcus opacus]QSE87250.1 alpha/beta fold hydrolase [Rhodococcus pseudokoreensis]